MVMQYIGYKRFRIHKTRIGCNCPEPAHCDLAEKRPLLGRDSLGHEQREIPGLVWEWYRDEQEVGPAGQRQSREIDHRDVLGPFWIA